METVFLVNLAFWGTRSSRRRRGMQLEPESIADAPSFLLNVSVDTDRSLGCFELSVNHQMKLSNEVLIEPPQILETVKLQFARWISSGLLWPEVPILFMYDCLRSYIAHYK